MAPSIAENARAHADQVEAEEQEQTEGDELEQPAEPPEAEPGDEPEPEPAHDPAEGLEEPTELMIEELRAARDEYVDRAHAIMGGFIEGWVLCEACDGLAITVERPSGPKLEPAPGLALCSVCKGAGELETPSTRQNYGVIQCVNCSGKGYVGTLAGVAHEVQQQVEQYPAGGEGQTATAAQPGQPESTDPFVAEAEQRGYIVLKKPGA